MPDHPCPTCNSTLGYYDGPNGVPRCKDCFADAVIRTVENPSPEPNAGGTSVAKASAQEKPDKADKQVKPVQVMTTSGTRPVEPEPEPKKEPAVTQREAQEQAKAEAAQTKKEPAAKPAAGKSESKGKK